MFSEFLQNGSVFAFLCMAYTTTVTYETINARQAFHGLNTPPILNNPLSGFIQLTTVPCLFWPPVYVGLFSGWLAGVTSWIIMLVGGGLLSIPLSIKKNVGFHYVPAIISMFVGYYLSITNMPS